MGKPKPNNDDTEKKKAGKRKRGEAEQPIQEMFGKCNPRNAHPLDIDQPTEYEFNLRDLGEKREGENFDKFEIPAASKTRGGAACNSVMIMKHNKPFRMWFDINYCPRVMMGKWCGYVAYAFRRRIPFGTYRTWPEVPDHIKDEAWADILSSWDFRTAFTEEDHRQLKKVWTTYASDRMRNWRTQVARRYIWEPLADPTIVRGNPWEHYRWMDPKEWASFYEYRTSPEFAPLRLKGQENADKKTFVQTTGSAGYRIIINSEEEGKRTVVIEEKVAEGVPREVAEVEALTMEIDVDRAIIFIMGNRTRKHPTITKDVIGEWAAEILKLSKEKEEGSLKMDGKEDILTRVTKKPDHGGRYRGCPGTARLRQAMPQYYAEKLKKKNTRRGTKLAPESSHASSSNPLFFDLQKLEKLTKWIQAELGVDENIKISPVDFFRQQLESEKSAVSDKDPPPNSQKTISTPCFVKVQDSCGTVKRAAAALIITRPENVPPQPGCQWVQIRPPILLPEARLPVYDLKYKNVSAAVGSYVNWPDEFIDYDDSPIRKKNKPKREKSPSLDDEWRSTDDDEHSEGKNADLNKSTSPQEQSSRSSMSPSRVNETSKDPSRVKETSESLSDDHSDSGGVGDDTNLNNPCPDVNWEYAHHVRDQPIREEFMRFLIEMKNHANGRDVYFFDLPLDVFNSSTNKVHIVLQEALEWIKSCNTERKRWIKGWQMDMWASFVHSMMPKADRGRVQLVPTIFSFNEHKKTARSAVDQPSFQQNLINYMKECPAKIFVMPSCRDEHWTVLLIVPEDSAIYCVDPLGKGVSKRKKLEYDALIKLGEAYDKEFRSEGTSSESHKAWNIVNLKHKQQPFGWECGYYCMLYVEKILLLHDTVDVQQIFYQDFDAYPMNIMEGLIDSFCRAFMDKFSAFCRLQNGRPRRSAVSNPST